MEPYEEIAEMSAMAMVGQAPYPSPIVASAPGIATSNQAGAAAPAIQQSQLRYPLLGGHAPPSPNAASAAAAAAAVSSTPPPYHPHGQPRYHPVYHPVYHHANLPALPAPTITQQLTMALAPTMTAAAPPPLPPPPLRPTASAAAAAAVAAAIQRAQGQPGGSLWEQPPPQQLYTHAHIHTQAGEIHPARSLSRMAATITQPHHRADPITASAVKAPAAEFELQHAILQAQIRTGGGGGNFTDLSATTAVEEDPRHLSVAAAAVVGQVLGKNSFEKKEEGVSEPPAIEKKKSRKAERKQSDETTPAKKHGGGGRAKAKTKAKAKAKTPLPVPTGPVATAADIAADSQRAHLEEAVSNSIFILCKEEKWADISALIASNPTLAVAPMTMANNITTTILHQAITSKGDVGARAGLVKFVLSIRPSAAAIKNGYGSLPIHVLAQRNCKMKSKVKEELLLALIHAHPSSITVAGGVGARNPLHIVFTDYISADLCRKMLTLRPDAAKMRDKKGWLPIHVATSRHCSPEKLDMLLEAYPESLAETTNDGKTPLMLAKSTATKQHPNRTLLKALEDKIKRGSNKNRKGMAFASPVRGAGLPAELPPPDQGHRPTKRRRRSSTPRRHEDETMPPLLGASESEVSGMSDAAGILLGLSAPV